MEVLNRYQTSDEREKFSADYERKYLKYENLPQPSITAVALNVQLYPKQRMLVTDGRYDLVNKTNAPISDIHVRKLEDDIEWLKLDVGGARLASDDKKFGYRIYHFDSPLAPGAKTTLTFKSRLWRRGFKAFSPDTDIIENGTFANNFEFAPVIGMNRVGLAQDRAKRRRQHLPAELRLPKLEDMSATNKNYIGSDWVTSDITLDDRRRPDSDRSGRPRVRRDQQRPPNRALRQHRADPQLLLDPVGRLQVASIVHNGVQESVYYHAGHDWNVAKMLRAMSAALDYYRANYGPYQFHYARIVEFPGYQSFAQAFAGTMPYSEIDRLQRQDRRSREDRLHHLCRRSRDVAPILGAPGDRRRHAGRDPDQRDACPIFGADGDEAPLRPGQDPPLPQV